MSANMTGHDDNDEHLTTLVIQDVVHDMIQKYQFADICPGCVGAIVSALVGTVAFNAVNPEDRERYLMDIVNGARMVMLSMEQRIEHKGVSH